MPSQADFTVKKRRNAISNKQRISIRKKKSENPSWGQEKLRIWAYNTFNLQLSQSTISETLGSKFLYLDEPNPTKRVLDVKKSRQAQYPLLEKALYDYLTRGWLNAFKSRHDYKKYRRQGESLSLTALDYQEELADLQEILKEYSSDDTYNADETGLYWRQSPSLTLADRPQKGLKLDKTRLTIFPCSNASGTHKLPLWLIGSAKNPRAFGREKQHIRGLPVHWKSNKKAWMTSVIMKEWLLWFDGQMGGRKVLLILDNFSAHEKAVCEAIEENLLRNTRVVFLPANTTALFQPMDQGIINNLKTYYRKLWLEFILYMSFQGSDPLSSITQLRAVLRIIEAWNAVKPLTIINCWGVSQLCGPYAGPVTRPKDYNEARAALQEVLDRARIHTLMDLSFLLTPSIDDLVRSPLEQIEDTEEDLLDLIANTFTEVYDLDPDDDLGGLLPRQITMSEASEAYMTLMRYQEQLEEIDFSFIQQLQHQQRLHLRRWQQARQEGLTQMSLDQYLSSDFTAN
ncbi:hypothetical protein HZS61_008940 [Fusarium oxysporum f. sp. conglutinans]|uniref:DDE-1 domain-containing protein n=1 Tax=Fusarium oxysporum f. sp. conglutinans TaxID=100902 RepID=A0A8H6G7N7_FUSOX|nr:hypothetical protein HZS61_007528 [Fusarium oxysporum f. sp. conglutinans]KAF6528638.1 hypothetical protein HZS61_008940 [Fusarium oxysporum f. sp. conglutinans]